VNNKSGVLSRPVNLVGLKMVREKRLGYVGTVTCSEDAIELVRRLFKDSYREIVAVIGLDTGNRPTAVHIVSIGSPEQAQVSIGNIFKPLLVSNAGQFILLHNHPADSLTPSTADRELTERLKKVGEMLEIKMLDHIILNSDGTKTYSFRNQGEW
jgi:DNA repair protein RadC